MSNRSCATEAVVPTAMSLIIEVKERLSEHMLREEEVIFDSLTSFSHDELLELVGMVLGSRPAETLLTTIQMEVTHLEPEHATHVLSTMCAVTSKTNFRAWLAEALPSNGNKMTTATSSSSVSSSHSLSSNCSATSSSSSARGGTQPHEVTNNNKKKADDATSGGKHRPHAPCAHYGAGASVLAPCCKVFVGCRRCHDETATCSVKPMDHRATRKMKCHSCGCAVRVAAYHCGICKLLDSSGSPTYHCPFCNVCRRGHGLGVDYHHCMKCNLCVAVEHVATHACHEDVRCALCTENFFESMSRVEKLPCGHAAHADCAALPDLGGCRLCTKGNRTTPTTQDSKRPRPTK